MTIKLYNSLTRKKEEFSPIDADNVRMYVCGPTVYDRPHIGNARAVVVYDVLYRLLRAEYGEGKVTYARNITDVDDKINAAAKRNGEPISNLTERVTGWFHSDMDALNNFRPDIEPKATEEIQAIIELIERIIANGHGYESEGHVLFDVGSVGRIPISNLSCRRMTASDPIIQRGDTNDGFYFYGKLSGKRQEDLIAGARVEVESYKRNSSDFVLWKPANEGDDESSVFDSPWGKGRPGWHIECSAMSVKYLGADFDIHGGGADLKFPHHENEIAQSCCGNESSSFANYWVHNGFLTVNGEKMSKSLGNFTTVHDLLEQGVQGEVIRYVLLSTKYSEPLDWSQKRIDDAKNVLSRFYNAYYLQYYPEAVRVHEDFLMWQNRYYAFQTSGEWEGEWNTSFTNKLYQEAQEAIYNDLNTPLAFSKMYEMTKLRGLGTIGGHPADTEDPMPFFSYRVMLKKIADLLGVLQYSESEWFDIDVDSQEIETLIEKRNAAKQNKNWADADKIRDELTNMGIILEDSVSGTKWRRK